MYDLLFFWNVECGVVVCWFFKYVFMVKFSSESFFTNDFDWRRWFFRIFSSFYSVKINIRRLFWYKNDQFCFENGIQWPEIVFESDIRFLIAVQNKTRLYYEVNFDLLGFWKSNLIRFCCKNDQFSLKMEFCVLRLPKKLRHKFSNSGDQIVLWGNFNLLDVWKSNLPI